MRDSLPTNESNGAPGSAALETPPSQDYSPSVASPTIRRVQSTGVVGPTPLKKLVVRGSVWTIFGYGSSQGLRLVSNLVLTHLLFPRAFGMMALVNVFVHGLAMFTDLGIGPSIVQNKRGEDPEFCDTAWTVQIIRGCVLWLGACALAWPTAYFYDEPLLLQLLPVAGFSALLAGLNSTKLFTANRHLILGRLTGIEIVSQLVGIVCMVSLAAAWRSVWVLVIGGLIAVVVKLPMSHLLLPGRINRLRWDRTALIELITFGRWIFVSTLLTFLAVNTDRMILGKFLSLDTLGVYSIGLFVAMAGAEVVNKITRMILMPALAGQARISNEQFEKAFIRGRRILLTGAALVTASTVLVAPALIHGLFDARYHGAAWIAQLLSVGIWFSMLQRTVNMASLALGASRPVALSHGCNFVTTLVAAPIGFAMFGLMGFIWGWSVGNLAGLIAIEIAMTRRGISLGWQDIKYCAVLTLAVALGIVLQLFARGQLQATFPIWAADIFAAGGLAVLLAPLLFLHLKSITSN